MFLIIENDSWKEKSDPLEVWFSFTLGHFDPEVD